MGRPEQQYNRLTYFVQIANNAASEYFDGEETLEYAIRFGMDANNGSRYGRFIRAVVRALQQSEGERAV